MNEPFQLVTNCTFKGKDYLVQMCVLNSKKLELIVTDKFMGEDWQCEYDASYIEALTHKTGNFKQFDVFVIMLKSGLLKTSECISLDLLTLQDLEHLRCKKIFNSNPSLRSSQSTHLNKRYLILTYSVEFDRIHYPLPLDYCGPPDPTVLQSNIRRLESEVERLKQKNLHLSRSDVGDTKKLKEKIQNLVEDKKFLTNEVHRLNKLLEKRNNRPGKSDQVLHNSLKKLEEQVIYEKKHNQQLISKLKSENKILKQKVEELKRSEKCLKLRIKERSRYNSQRECRKTLRNYVSPDNSLDRKSAPDERAETQVFCRPVASWNASSIYNRNEVKMIKRSQNRFISSSSSDSERENPHRARSRVKKPQPPSREDLCLKKSESRRRSSNERSKHSSEHSKKNLSTQRSKTMTSSKHGSSQEGEKNRPHSSQPPEKTRSRETSLSSRNSSKQSRVSRHSNRGSGDYRAPKSIKTTKSTLDERADLKFSVSDLETRIHALQKLLKEGLNF